MLWLRGVIELFCTSGPNRPRTDIPGRRADKANPLQSRRYNPRAHELASVVYNGECNRPRQILSRSPAVMPACKINVEQADMFADNSKSF